MEICLTERTNHSLERNGVRKNEMKTKEENPVLLQFKAESLEQLEEFSKHLEERGVKVFDRLKQTSYGFITNFCDPDGNKVEVISQ